MNSASTVLYVTKKQDKDKHSWILIWYKLVEKIYLSQAEISQNMASYGVGHFIAAHGEPGKLFKLWAVLLIILTLNHGIFHCRTLLGLVVDTFCHIISEIVFQTENLLFECLCCMVRNLHKCLIFYVNSEQFKCSPSAQWWENELGKRVWINMVELG